MKKIIGAIISYLFLFYFLVWFVPFVLFGHQHFCPKCEIMTVHDLISGEEGGEFGVFRYFTAISETKLDEHSPEVNYGSRIDWWEITVQEKYLKYGIAGQSWWQLLLPFIITYLAFFTKYSIIGSFNLGLSSAEKDSKVNYLQWLYTIILLFWVVNFIMWLDY